MYVIDKTIILTRKNLILKRRSIITTIGEFIIPLFFVILFAVLKTQTFIVRAPEGWTVEVADASQCPFRTESNRTCSYPYSRYLVQTPFFNELVVSSVNQIQHAKIFLATKKQQDVNWAYEFQQFLFNQSRANYENATIIFENGLESDVQKYMKSPSYGRPFTPDAPFVAAIIVFNEMDMDRQYFDYTIRINSSSSGTLRTPSTGIGRSATDDSTHRLHWWHQRRYSQEGFLSLQLLIDSFIIQNERFIPQNPYVQALPVKSYVFDEFFGYVIALFALAFILSFLYPVSQIISSLTLEKETRTRELLKIMGTNDKLIVLSWFVLYTGYFFMLSLLIVVISTTLFPSTYQNTGGAFYIFLLFFLFGLSSLSYCFLVSTFFSSSRAASIAGTVLFFLLFFVYYNVAGEGNEKVWYLMLFPQVPFALACENIASLESDGVGLSTTMLTFDINGFQTLNAYLYLLLDIVLYTLLGLYCNEVIPQYENARVRSYLFIFEDIKYYFIYFMHTRRRLKAIEQQEKQLQVTVKGLKEKKKMIMTLLKFHMKLLMGCILRASCYGTLQRSLMILRQLII